MVTHHFIVHHADKSFCYMPCVLPRAVSRRLVNVVVDGAFHRMLSSRCSGSLLDGFPCILEQADEPQIAIVKARCTPYSICGRIDQRPSQPELAILIAVEWTA